MPLWISVESVLLLAKMETDGQIDRWTDKDCDETWKRQFDMQVSVYLIRRLAHHQALGDSVPQHTTQENSYSKSKRKRGSSPIEGEGKDFNQQSRHLLDTSMRTRTQESTKPFLDPT